MHGGYVLLWRKLLESAIFEDAELLRLFVWCLLRANYKPTIVSVPTGRGRTLVEVGRGQFVMGRHTTSNNLRIAGTTLVRRMEKLKKLGIVDTQSTAHYTVVTVCNYERYQNPEYAADAESGQARGQATVTQRSPNGQATVTENTYKKEKKEKNGSAPAVAGGLFAGNEQVGVADHAPSRANPFWDAVCRIWGLSPATRTECAYVGKLASEFRRLGAGEAEIRERLARYRARWPNVEASPTALLKHWSAFGPNENGERRMEPWEIESQRMRALQDP